MDRDIGRDLQQVYEAMEGSDASLQFSERHGIQSQAVLTVVTDEIADMICERFHDRIAGKTVVEIGGGIGLLALHMGMRAKRVYCIEANPMWSWVFAGTLLRRKPRNVSFLFGAADEFVGAIKGDVAIFCAHSGLDSMRLVAQQFAPEVIDIHGELIAASPGLYDPVASALRKVV